MCLCIDRQHIWSVLIFRFRETKLTRTQIYSPVQNSWATTSLYFLPSSQTFLCLWTLKLSRSDSFWSTLTFVVNISRPETPLELEEAEIPHFRLQWMQPYWSPQRKSEAAGCFQGFHTVHCVAVLLQFNNWTPVHVYWDKDSGPVKGPLNWDRTDSYLLSSDWIISFSALQTHRPSWWVKQ